MKVWFLACSACVLGLAISATLAAFTTDDLIVFKDEPSAFKPEGYYIAGVTDDRATNGFVAQLIIFSADKKPGVQTAVLAGGVGQAVNKFISRNIEKVTSQQPVSISIKELKLTETLLQGNKIDGQVKISLTFGLQKDYGAEPLVTYNGGIHYTRSANSTPIAEPKLRAALKSGLVYFNNWMQVNQGTNIKLAKRVAITFTDYHDQGEGDTIYYLPTRKLTWADFQSRVAPGGPYAAMVMPGFGYDEQHNVVGGVIRVTLAMKTYLPKSACWADSFGRNRYSLNHEQRHFDIARIITHQYRRKILDEKLTPDTWEALISMQYLDSYRDMHTMQTAYDKETAHGRNQFVQEDWNNRIDKDLNAGATLLN